MNTRTHEDLERQLLLAASGELTPEDVRALDRVLATDPAAAATRQELHDLLAAAATALPTGTPSRAVLAAIERQAARHAQRRWRPSLLQVLAYAAMLLIAVSAWILCCLPAAPHPHDRITEMHALVAVSGEAVALPMAGAAAASADDEHERLRELAAQLLALEGFGAEPETEESEDGAAVRGPEALSPTALQPRSRLGLRAKIHG